MNRGQWTVWVACWTPKAHLQKLTMTLSSVCWWLSGSKLPQRRGCRAPQRLPSTAEAHSTGRDGSRQPARTPVQSTCELNLYRKIREPKSGHFPRRIAGRHPSFPSPRGSEDPAKPSQPPVQQKCNDGCVLCQGAKFRLSITQW